MLTWSSWLPDVGIESTLAGWASPLHSLTRAACVYWAIMNRLDSPAFAVRNSGSPRVAPGARSHAVRRSLMFASPVIAIASWSIA